MMEYVGDVMVKISVIIPVFNDKNICFPNENLIHGDNPFFYDVIISANRISIINQNILNFFRFDGLRCEDD